MAKKKRKQPRPQPSAGRNDRPAPAARSARPRLAPDRWVLGLAALGLLLTGYLTLAAWSSAAPALCAEGSACDVIQNSQWSMLLGLPIALWGFAVYALIALAAATGSTFTSRWRRLSRLTLLGLSISVYLTVVGIVSLDAVCAWCLASLATMAALFVLVHLRRPGAPSGEGSWGNWWLGNGLAAVAVLAALHVGLTGLLDRRPENPRVAALVDHLQATGARYYGASWCGSCRQQTRLFGASANRLPYVECSPQGRGGPVARVCVDAGVASYPTWQINGLLYSGLQQPEELAQLSGFAWERE